MSGGDPGAAPMRSGRSAPAPNGAVPAGHGQTSGGRTVPLIAPSGVELGRVIRRLRRARRLTIEDLASAANIHPTYLSGIERGIRNPTWEKVCTLAIALGVPFSALVRDTEVEAQLEARIRQARSEIGWLIASVSRTTG